MTEDEGIKLTEVGNKFWGSFSKLVGESVNEMPVHLRDETLEKLSDLTSVYSCEFEKYLE